MKLLGSSAAGSTRSFVILFHPFFKNQSSFFVNLLFHRKITTLLREAFARSRPLLCISFCGDLFKCAFLFAVFIKLEDVDVLVADHVSRVHKTNFLASWEEIGDEFEMQDTYALTQMSSLEGNAIKVFLRISPTI